MDQCYKCKRAIPTYETNVGRNNEDLCNGCYSDQTNKTLTDFQLAAKIQKFALDINRGLTYPLESLDRLIELGEDAKKFKEGN